MIYTHSDESIEEFFGATCREGQDRYYSEPSISVSRRTYKGRERIKVTVGREYSIEPLTFAQLKKVSEFFETDAIDITSDESRGGCETCDYGSFYSYTLEIG